MMASFTMNLFGREEVVWIFKISKCVSKVRADGCKTTRDSSEDQERKTPRVEKTREGDLEREMCPIFEIKRVSKEGKKRDEEEREV